MPEAPNASLIDHRPVRLPGSLDPDAFEREMARGAARIKLSLRVPLHSVERLEDLSALLCQTDPSRTVDALATEALNAFLAAQGA